ncbi:hypothetical protein NLX67_21270 [Domibacillus sp. A3M-37]|uniref:hypothetical protein n=1 Tax=Domibacillus sp. A3M-37 TaxID=2962037 RepID=UPI0020B7C987|nr:hypothetical protein [Domibacillus sp. A3M-37]MCP3764854.1 hypothetical protein [Domibacillus sp. A3M-37]
MKKAINLLGSAKFSAEEFMMYRLQSIINNQFQYSEIHLFMRNAADFLEYSTAIAKLEGRNMEQEKQHVAGLTDVLIRENRQCEENLVILLVAFRESIKENTIEQFLKNIED